MSRHCPVRKKGLTKSDIRKDLALYSKLFCVDSCHRGFRIVVVFHFTDADPNAVAGHYTSLVARDDRTSVTLNSTASDRVWEHWMAL
jgi:hypothetical protein